MRTGDFYVFRAKAVIVCAGGASHIFKPRSVGEGMGRTWYAPWSSASAYALPIQVGAKMTQMENRIVLTRFKDGYGPVGAYFLHLKTYTQNAYGEEYETQVVRRAPSETVGDYVDHHPVPTCLRNHAFLEEIEGRPRPDPHGDEGSLPGSAQGDGRLGELPRHDDRAGGRLGVAEHRPQAHQSRADHVRALRHGLARDLLRRVGERARRTTRRRSTSGATTA